MMEQLSRRRMICALAAGATVPGAVLLTTAAPAAAQPAVVAPVEQLVAALLRIMQAGTATPFEQRFQVMAPVIQRVFDLEAILRASVGSAWNMMPPDQQDTLRSAFLRYSVASYVNSFDTFNGQRFEVLPNARPVGNGDQVVKTRIIPRSGTTHELDYVMRQVNEGWRIVDVLAEGSISRVAVQRSDFRRLLSRGGVAALASSLREKYADLSGG